MDPVVVEVEAERPDVTGTQRQGGCGFGGVGEPDDMVEAEGSVGGGDVAEHSAGADRAPALRRGCMPNSLRYEKRYRRASH